MQQKTLSDSDQSQKVQQFIITDEQIGEIHDFVNNSLSDAYYQISQSKIQKQSEPTPLSNEELRSQRMSVDSPEGLFILQTSTNREQKDEQQHQLTIFQSWNAIKFIRRISERKRINTKFSQYQYDLLNDKGSSFDLKLFKESSLHFKPIHRRLQRANQVEEIVKPSIIQLIKSYLLQQKQNILQGLHKFEQQLQKIPLISPESRWKIIWDCFVAIARLYFLYVIPIDLGWTSLSVIYGQLYPVSILAIVILLIDFIISFNNSFYQFGQIANQRAIIAKHVITKSYGLESISLLILCIYLFNTNYNSIDVTKNSADILIALFYVQSRNIPKLIAQIEEVLNLSKPVSSMLELFKLILVLFFVLHCYSCLWFFVGEYSHNHRQGSWLEPISIEHETFNVQYLYSFYYATVTMFTIGYGDITPVSYVERIVAIFYMMICSIQLSYSVSTVGTILDQISAYEHEKMKKVHTINTYMQNKKIGYELQYQVREYLNYYWKSQSQVESQDEQHIINQLSQNLREKLMLEANSIILNECPLFKNHFSEQLKNKLVRQIKQTVIQPENIIEFDQIFPALPNGQIFMCFIEHGEVQILIQNDYKDSIYSNQQASVIAKVGRGSSLGIFSFISGQKSREKFRSLGFTKLLLLSREDFLKILPDFPEDYERFRNIHDGLLYNQDYLQNMKCFSCQSSAHRVMDCPLLHFVPDKEFIIKKHLFTKEHQRQPNYTRNQNRQNQYHAVLDQEEIEDIAQFYASCNTKWTEFYDEPPEDDEITSSQIKKIDVNVQSPELLQSPIAQIKIPQTRYSLLNKRGSTVDGLESDENRYKLAIPNRAKPRRLSNIQQLKSIDAKSCTTYGPSQGNSRRLRPSCTIEFSRFRSMQVIAKFKKIVQMVIKLNVLKKKKSTKKNLSNKFQEIQQQSNYMKKILEKTAIRIKQIEQGKKELLSDIDVQNTYLLSIKISMLITAYEEYFVNKTKVEYFDVCKEFQYYQIQNNFTKVLEKEEFYYQQKKMQPNLSELRKKLVQYLMFPQMYLEKYKYVKLQLVNLLTQRHMRDENNRSYLLPMSKRNKFRGKTFRAPKPNQILPK